MTAKQKAVKIARLHGRLHLHLHIAVEDVLVDALVDSNVLLLSHVQEVQRVLDVVEVVALLLQPVLRHFEGSFLRWAGEIRERRIRMRTSIRQTIQTATLQL